MADNTVFDSVFKTLVQKSPQLVIPLINEAFGRDYGPDERVELFSTEHESVRGTVIADSVFRLHGKIYHVECQSTPDSAMVIRMIEYDFAIALEGAIASGSPCRMEFPNSRVLFLGHGSRTPDVLEIEVALPGGGSFAYGAKVVKAQRFTRGEIFARRLLLLLPFYLMRYEGELPRIAGSEEETNGLVAECAELRAELEEATLAAGDTLLYEELTELIIRVSDYTMRAHGALREKVRRAMGGEVLELLRERAERLEREALAKGIEQGIEQGIERGKEQGAGEVLELLRERGVDEALLEEAEKLVAQYRTPSEEGDA